MRPIKFAVDTILDFQTEDDGSISVCIDYGPGETYGGSHPIKREKIPSLIEFLQAAYTRHGPAISEEHF